MRHFLATTCILVSVLVVPAASHEFIVKPSTLQVREGDPLGLSAISAHVFMKSAELEVEKDVRIGLVVDGRRQEFPIKARPAELIFQAEAVAPTNKTFIAYGTRMLQIWATTPDGVKPATKRTPGATNAFKMEKFSKAILNAKSGDPGFSAVIGDPLEITLLTNPAETRVGQEVTVRVTYKGQPLATNIYATYDGFSDEENTYAYFTEGKGDGTAKVKISHPGLWMVRVQHAASERTDDYDRALARAVLLFSIQ